MKRLKKFLEEHDCHLKIAIQHLGIFGGGFNIQVYNTTCDYLCQEPIFEHFISDEDIAKLNVDFDTAIMIPIENWWNDFLQKRGGRQ